MLNICMGVYYSSMTTMMMVYIVYTSAGEDYAE